MKKIILALVVTLSLAACMTTDGVSTTGKEVSTSFDATTDTTSSSSGESKDSNWQYEQGQPTQN